MYICASMILIEWSNGREPLKTIYDPYQRVKIIIIIKKKNIRTTTKTNKQTKKDTPFFWPFFYVFLSVFFQLLTVLYIFQGPSPFFLPGSKQSL